jgi:DNA-binding GntR family transcriptional regulator
MLDRAYGEGRSRTSRAYDRIRDDIIRGLLAPGAKLKIAVLRSHYEIGATPIREALSLLTAEGLVERLDQRGFRVAEVSAAEFEELLAARCWLEGRALRLAIARGGREWEERIVLARYRLSRTARVTGPSAEDNRDWERNHKQFHMSLVAACGSDVLLRLCSQLYDENNRYRFLSRSYDRPDVYVEHDQIAEAVLARNADLAVERIVEHYTRTGDLLRQAFAARDQRSD